MSLQGKGCSSTDQEQQHCDDRDCPASSDAHTGKAPSQAQREQSGAKKERGWRGAGHQKSGHGMSGVNLPPYLSLSLCYLACVFLRQAVTPKDLVDWVKGLRPGCDTAVSGPKHAAPAGVGVCGVYFGFWRARTWDDRLVPRGVGPSLRPVHPPEIDHIHDLTVCARVKLASLIHAHVLAHSKMRTQTHVKIRRPFADNTLDYLLACVRICINRCV